MIVGGGGSGAFVADTAVVAATAAALTECASTLAGAHQYGAVAGLGEAAELEVAAAAFRDRWGTSLATWQTSLAAFGAAVGSAAQLMDAEESRRAAALRGIEGLHP